MTPSPEPLARPRDLFNDALFFMELGQALPRNRGVEAERWRYFRTAILLALAALEHHVRQLGAAGDEAVPPPDGDLWHWLAAGEGPRGLRAFQGGGGPAFARLLTLRSLLLHAPREAELPTGWDPRALDPGERADRALTDTRRLLARLAAQRGDGEPPPWSQETAAGPPG